MYIVEIIKGNLNKKQELYFNTEKQALQYIYQNYYKYNFKLYEIVKNEKVLILYC